MLFDSRPPERFYRPRRTGRAGRGAPKSDANQRLAALARGNDMALEARQPRFRIGIDTGGTFTDIVSVDGASGAMRVTKVASTPSNPAIGLVRGVKAILDAGGASLDDLAGLAHGTTVATNALLQGEIAGLGLIVTEGFRHILEIARQAVPEGYGNSYFWVKPDRLVPLQLVREVGGRLNFRGEELRPIDEVS